MNKKPQDRQGAAEAILAQVDMLSQGHLDPAVDLVPIDVSMDGGEPVVVVVVKQSTWAELTEAIREHGGREIMRLIQ